MKKFIFGLGLAFSLALLPGLVSAAVTPVPLSPKNNAVGYNADTTFLQWSRVPEATEYTLQVKADNNNFNDATTFNLESDDNYKLASDGLGITNNGKTYYWRVKVSGDENNWSSTFKFSTVVNANKATNLSPSLYKGNPTKVDLNAKETMFSWKNDKNTVYNEISLKRAVKNANIWECSGDELFVKLPTFVGTSFSSNLFIRNNINTNDTYCWKVISYSNNGTAVESSLGFFELTGFKDNASVKVTPLFAQYNFGKLVMYWSKAKINGNEAYKVKVSTSPKLENDKSVTQNVINQNYLVADDGPLYTYLVDNSGKKLYWNVQVVGNGSWSKVASFQPSSLGKSTLNTPATNVTGKATTTTFTWNKPAGEAIFYKLEFVNGGNKAVYYTTNRSYKPAASHPSTATLVANPGAWTWTVTAYNNNSVSPVSDGRIFNQQ